MASQIAEVAELKEAIRDEKFQVDAKFGDLEDKIAELQSQTTEMDLSEVLASIRSIREDVANIYEPANPEESVAPSGDEPIE